MTWLSLLVVAALGFGSAARAEEGVELTYLGNEGFLLVAGETKVLIDALHGDGIPGYVALPATPRAELEAARGRFAGVDLVLATHRHGDHFDPKAVARFLAAAPSAVFVSTPQAVERLMRQVGSGLSGRIEAVLPQEGERLALERAGVPFQVLNLHHGRDRRPPTQNLGFVVELGGLRFLHVGDTEVSAAEVRPLGLERDEIDVALLASWQIFAGAFDAARVGRVVPMHLPAEDAPSSFFGSRKNLRGMIESLEARSPGAVMLTVPLASHTFRASAGAGGR